MTQSEAYLLTIDKALEAIFSSDDVPMSLMEQVINEMPTCLWEEMLDAFGFEFSEDCRDDFCPVNGHYQSGSGDWYADLNGETVAGPERTFPIVLGVALEHLQDNADTIDVLEWLNKRLAETKADSQDAFNSMTGNPLSALNNLSIRKVA